MDAKKPDSSGAAAADSPLEPSPTSSSEKFGTVNDVNAGAESNTPYQQMDRYISPLHLHIISLGSSVGSGLFIGTGQALALGGPGSMVIAYILVCTGAWANLQSLAEMTIAYPVSGNFVDFAGRWVDDSLAFAAGFCEWLGWTSVFASEAAFVVVLINYWANEQVHQAVWLSIYLVISVALFAMPNKIYVWAQTVGSAVKIFLFAFVVIVMLCVIGGAGPQGYVHDGSTWTDEPAFKNGFSGFCNAAMRCMWAIGDLTYLGVINAEAQYPRVSMAKVANVVPWRVSVMYVGLAILISVTVSSSDPRLLGGSGAAASPLVIAVANVGIPGVPDFINACMIIGVFAIGLESIYLPSRILRHMAVQKLVPSFFDKLDSRGRPIYALAFTLVIGITLTYMNLGSNAYTVLNWLINITSASFFLNWLIIGITSLRFRAALKAQRIDLFIAQYAWKCVYPFAPMYLVVVSVFLAVCCIYVGAVPPTGGGFTANNFFLYIIGMLIIAVFTVAYKLAFRTKAVRASEADCKTGRREVTDPKELQILDDYYRIPKWRRALRYALVA